MKNNFPSLLVAALALIASDAYAAGTHTTPCYTAGKVMTVDSGCTLEVKSGGTLLEDSGATITNSGSSTWADGKNIVLGTTTGSEIGTGATQLLGFYGATPVVQVGASVDTITGLQNLGLFAAGTHPYNKVTITAPATGSTLTIPDGVVLTGPAASGTAATLANAETLTNKTITDFIDSGTVVSSAISAASGSTGTTLTNIPGLTVALTASKTYAFHAYVTGTATTNGGVKLAFANSGTTTSGTYTCSQTNNATINAKTTTTTFGNAVGAATTVWTSAECDGVIVVNGAGNLTMQFAQNVSHADTTTVNANGYMIVRRLN